MAQMNCRQALQVIDELMRDVPGESFETATHWDRRQILPKDREALKVIHAILEQQGCEHLSACDDGKLTTLMDIVIFG